MNDTLPQAPSLPDGNRQAVSKEAPRWPEEGRSISLTPLVVPALVALPAAALLYDNGSYGAVSRYTLAVGVWVAVAVLSAAGVGPRRLTASQSVAGIALGAFAVWTAVSAEWGASTELAVDAATLSALYLGLLVLTWTLTPIVGAGRWLDGLTLAGVAVLVGALVSRFWPGLLPDHGIAELIPGEAARLSFPLGYWNGLAILLAVLVPLLGRAAVDSPRAAVRAAAAGAVPAVGSVVYLASSRTGTVAFVAGLVLFVGLSALRWRAALFAVTGVVGSASMAVLLASREALANGPLDTAAARAEGREAALALVVACIAAGVSYLAAAAVLERYVRPGRLAGYAVAAVAAILAVLAIVASEPIERFEQFKTPLSGLEDGDYVQSHLLSSSGNGRWQLWTAAVDQWQEDPVRGGGAGSYERWWLEHASFPLFVRNAHSLYLETLAELGVVGLAFLVGGVGALLLGGIGAVRTAAAGSREPAAAGTAAFAALLLASAADWMWQLPAVMLFGIAVVAGVSAPANRVPPPARRGRLLRTVFTVAGITAVTLLLTPWLATLALDSSRDRARVGEWQLARADAEQAYRLSPWATSPRTQLALLNESRGRNRLALAWIDRALAADDGDWRLWFVRARVLSAMGGRTEALSSFERAVALNPRSPALVAARTALARRAER